MLQVGVRPGEPIQVRFERALRRSETWRHKPKLVQLRALASWCLSAAAKTDVARHVSIEQISSFSSPK
ncbi:hypothetical protein CU103_22005 [Phyllobacterium sophorae]|uniref:Uncharacterized protein n=1 Tax=Phyllobacterium sophorae TaxID=1520277 RepID=A0A2P7B4W3_9HYPH|nr:hypothetical protein CU103_22005 [Phyllobacterium sophorae]